jgi:hypothetical protein
MANTVSITNTGLDSREGEMLDHYEMEQAEREHKATKPVMNYGKLAKWNMAQPWHKRVNAADVESSCRIAGFRGFAMALLATIHSKIDNKIAEKEALFRGPSFQEQMDMTTIEKL